MRVALLSREYPPDVYGGAGAHVEYLARELWNWSTSRCTARRPATGRTAGVARGDPHPTWDALEGDDRHLGALRTVATDLSIAARSRCRPGPQPHLVCQPGRAPGQAALRHPHVVSVHSLEPLRPWKVEQLGGGYHVSRFCEQTSIEAADRVIAVSAGMAADILSVYPAVDSSRLQVIHNGIDTDQYRPDHGTDVLEAYGSTPTGRRSSSSVASPARRASPPARRRPGPRPGGPADPLRRRARHPELGREVSAKVEQVRQERAASSGSRRCWSAARSSSSSPPPPCSSAPRSTSPRHRQPGGHGLRDGRGRHRHRRHPRGGRQRRDRPLVPFESDGSGEPASPTASPPTSPSASTASSPTPPSPTPWARPAAAAPSSSSAGPRSPARPPPSTPA